MPVAVAKKVERLPATRDAFSSGELSEVQVEAVASAAAVDPSSEHELLETARTADLASLRDKARRVRLSAIHPEELSRRQHTLREFSHHVDDDGMVAGRFRLPPEIGAPIVSRIEAETDRVYRTAYREGRREPRVAYAADAFVRKATRARRSGVRHRALWPALWGAVRPRHAVRQGRAHLVSQHGPSLSSRPQGQDPARPPGRALRRR